SHLVLGGSGFRHCRLRGGASIVVWSVGGLRAETYPSRFSFYRFSIIFSLMELFVGF
ncbi:hypothetical protein A2U01_0043851, partial [Trifolium medium]|nr:hypothetical protein [Trifolium medium]